MSTPRRNWNDIVAHAETIVTSYSTPVTLRQLFYRLVSDGTLSNNPVAYKSLSAYTAKARREAGFPALLDMTRTTNRPASWDGPEEFVTSVVPQYRRDHTEGQDILLVLGAEKATLLAQFNNWFGDLHVPTVVLRGFSSQTYTDDVRDMVLSDGRPAVLLYVGDMDASGEDIERDFVKRTDCWKLVQRLAVTDAHLTTYSLVKQPGKAKDSRAAAFKAKYGSLFQVEVEALDPTDLHAIVKDGVDEWWDEDAFLSVLQQEKTEQDELMRRWA